MIKKFKLKTADNMKHKLKKTILIALQELQITEAKLTEQSFTRFWYYFTSLVYNVKPQRSNTIKQSEIVFFFETKGHGLAADIVKGRGSNQLQKF